MLARIDGAAIRGATAAYLWLLDWTGVYVGTVQAFLIVVDSCRIVTTPAYTVANKCVLLAFAGWLLFAAWGAWLLQNEKEHERINLGAMRWQSLLLRKVLVVFTILMLVWDTYRVDWNSIMLDAWMLTYGYLLCVMVRDREPPEFLQPQVHHG
jgi:hypothetical protein